MAITLIVETGSIVQDANSYVTLEEANTYNELNNEDWASFEDDSKIKALILATKSLDLLYGPKYASVPNFGSTQSLLWPRLAFWARYSNRLIQGNEIPREIKNAQCEMAMMYLNNVDLFPLQQKDNVVTSESISIGDLSTSKTYATAVSPESYPEFRKVDLILQSVLKCEDSSWVWAK